MLKYLKLRMKKDASGPHAGRTIYLSVTSETEQFYIGRRVDREGDDFSYERSDGTIIDTIDIIHRDAVKWAVPVGYDKYGFLVEKERVR